MAATERGVKAAFLYKFVAYVDWPATAFSQADAPIVIGVVGADDIAAELQQSTTSRTVNNRPIVVRRMRDGDSLAGLHMLFIGRGEAGASAGARPGRPAAIDPRGHRQSGGRWSRAPSSPSS